MNGVSKNKFVIIDFWASWCAPCKEEIKELKKIYQKYKDRDDIIIVSISIDKDSEKWKKAIAKEDIKWLQLLDSDNKILSSLDIKHVPHSFFLSPNEYLGGRTSLSNYIFDMLKRYIR